MRHIYHHDRPFELESGERLEQLDIAYDVYGDLDAPDRRVVWVCHALTANSAVDEWWPHTVETGCFLDPEKVVTVCANIICSCYGTTGPTSTNPATGQPYYGDFPRVTMRDIVRAHILLADRLGIDRIHALVGSSVGGFQAVEWAVEQPRRFDRLVLIATDTAARPWTIAIDETQRMAIRADSTFGLRRADAGKAGLAAARAIGLLTYRGSEGYNLTQHDPADADIFALHRAATYQRHQGDKLVARFDAYSYMAILDAFDTHDIGRGRGGEKAALRRLSMPVIVVGLSTDIIFTPDEMRDLAGRIDGATYAEICSEFGHDGFLVEHGQLNQILKPFLDTV